MHGSCNAEPLRLTYSAEAFGLALGSPFTDGGIPILIKHRLSEMLTRKLLTLPQRFTAEL